VRFFRAQLQGKVVQEALAAQKEIEKEESEHKAPRRYYWNASNNKTRQIVRKFHYAERRIPRTTGGYASGVASCKLRFPATGITARKL
jgi:hypothetical protein